MNEKLLTAFDEYMYQIMGMRFKPKVWYAYSTLPIYIQESYFVSEIILFGLPYLLVYRTSKEDLSPAVLKKQLGKIEESTNIPVIYLADNVTSSNRRRWIEQRIRFVVPGNQMYVPDAGVDLREYFREESKKAPSLSPSTQAIILYAIVNHDYREYTTTEMAKQTGYTVMTLNRIFDELVEFELADAKYLNREHVLTFNYKGKELWDKCISLFRNPTKKEIGIECISREAFSYKYAGLSALAKQSMLIEPDLPIYAMSQVEYKVALNARLFKESQSNWFGESYLEIWSYSPGIITKEDIVDSLSLYLTLQNEDDARVDEAKEKLLEGFKW